MTLPIRTTMDDIFDVCGYLAKKPTGVTLADAKKVLDSKRLDGRKISALVFWGLIKEEEGKYKTTTAGRDVVKGEAAAREVMANVIRDIPAYQAIIERAAMRRESSLSSLDVGAHWHDHFPSEIGGTDRIVNDQAVCFFNVAEGAGLGRKIKGAQGNPTRFGFDEAGLEQFTSNVPRTGTRPRTDTIQPQPPRTAIVDDDSSPTLTPVTVTNDQQYLQRGLIVDCYKLRNRIGSGFSAEVWTARVQKVPPGVDLEKGQEVAIKFYTSSALAIPNQVIRVEREYRVAQRLRHPNLIRIYEFMLASPRPFHNFLVMDVAQGPTLSSLITTHKLDTSDILRIIAQIFSGTEALHSAAALHRDIKPGNISVELSENKPVRAILLDLGIVSLMFEKSVTAVSRFVGSKHWAPLEQLVGQNLDERSDIYSIGAVAYNILVGVEPYTSSTTEAAVAVEMQSGGSQIPALAEVPTEVIGMLNSCLSNKPEERPRNARECLTVLAKHGITP